MTTTDLNTLADQLERIAGQMTNLQTSARMEVLAVRTRKILANNVQRLEKHRDEIVYRLTALEVHLFYSFKGRPTRAYKSSLNHSILFIDSGGENI